ncbi:hypothetical protein GCM10020229_16330 [Kitasatospora albolonga]|uniref:hypothetical protein n=1 Tax=Kitasatospora albolonga TaxID=68173 RepID=UPI0031EB54B9
MRISASSPKRCSTESGSQGSASGATSRTANSWSPKLIVQPVHSVYTRRMSAIQETAAPATRSETPTSTTTDASALTNEVLTSRAALSPNARFSTAVSSGVGPVIGGGSSSDDAAAISVKSPRPAGARSAAAASSRTRSSGRTAEDDESSDMFTGAPIVV